MKETKIITGTTITGMWEKITGDMKADEPVLEYNAILDFEKTKIFLEIDIDPGGGFESGYETTKFTGRLYNSGSFRFAIHHEGFIDEIGKFFGMQDVATGFPEFDKNVVVKTNDDEKVKLLFTDENVRSVFQQLAVFTFHTTHHHLEGTDGEGTFLELNIEEGITDSPLLEKIYTAFYKVLVIIEGLSGTR